MQRRSSRPLQVDSLYSVDGAMDALMSLKLPPLNIAPEEGPLSEPTRCDFRHCCCGGNTLISFFTSETNKFEEWLDLQYFLPSAP
jgi:hypothetical protein